MATRMSGTRRETQIGITHDSNQQINKALTFKGHPQPEPNERLLAAKNFLADEDINRCLNFMSRLEVIEEYLEYLTKEEIGCHEALFNDVKVMCKVQRDWIARTSLPKFDGVTFNLPNTQHFSGRLLGDKLCIEARKEREALGLTGMREDFVPFTVQREPDQLEFLRAMNRDACVRSDSVDMKTNLSSIEMNAYAEGLRNPTIIPSKMSKSQGESVNDNFIGKAQRRGIQRAAIELALNLFARNEEQNRPSDRFRRLELPAKWEPPIKEVPLWRPLESTKRPLEQDPFKYTKIMMDYRFSMQWDYSVGLWNIMAEHENDAKRAVYAPVPINWNGPYLAPTGRERADCIKRQQNVLTQVFAKLLTAEMESPRPFIQSVIQRIDFALKEKAAPDTRDPLTREDLQRLSDLGEKSWHKVPRPDKHASLASWGVLKMSAAGVESTDRMVEFVKHALEFEEEMPFWSGDNTLEFFWPNGQASPDGMALRDLLKKVNDERLRCYNELPQSESGQYSVPMIKESEADMYLLAMDTQGWITYDRKFQQVARKYMDGHPENKYAFSKAEAAEMGTVQYNADGDKGPAIIIHDPHHSNKVDYFHQLGLRLGTSIRRFTEEIGVEWDSAILINKQNRNIMEVELQISDRSKLYRNERRRAEELNEKWEEPAPPISLIDTATTLNRVAPDLAKEVGINFNPATITEQEAAKVIQMQILEEANNNWEYRFPEREQVWSFAASRLSATLSPTFVQPRGEELNRITTEIEGLKEKVKTLQTKRMEQDNYTRADYNQLTHLQAKIVDLLDSAGKPKPKPKQYFSSWRWPLVCQPDDIQAIIAGSGPVIQPKRMPVHEKTGEKNLARIGAPTPRERHYGKGQPPYFPFGETPYQQAYLSFRMEQELKNVPGFQIKDASGTTAADSNYVTDGVDATLNPYALPELPKDWKPRNISFQEAHFAVDKMVKDDPWLPREKEVFGRHGLAYIAELEEEKKKKNNAADDATGIAIATGSSTRSETRAEAEVARRERDLQELISSMVANGDDPTKILDRLTRKMGKTAEELTPEDLKAEYDMMPTSKRQMGSRNRAKRVISPSKTTNKRKADATDFFAPADEASHAAKRRRGEFERTDDLDQRWDVPRRAKSKNPMEDAEGWPELI